MGGTGTTRTSPHAWLRILVAGFLLLSVTACGARWSDEQRAQVLARSEGGSGGEGDRASGPTTTVARSATSMAGDDGASGSGGPGGPAGGGTDGAGGGGEGGGGTGGPAPCEAPSDAPGVSDDTITIGTVSSLSGPVPGLGESALAAVRSYVEYRNATGGVCGRQLALQSADDGADNGRFRSHLNELGPRVLAFAGGITGGDAGGADVIDQLQIPYIVASISKVFEDAEYVLDLYPDFDGGGAIGKYDYLFDQGVRTASLVLAGLDQTRAEADKQQAVMEASGIRVVDRQELPLATLSYDSAARRVANSKADYMLFIYDAGNSASMARSMAGTGYEPKFEEYLVAYGTNFIEAAGPGAEGTVSWLRFIPNEEAGGNAEQTAFLEWMDRVSPGIPRDNFAVDSWAAAKALVDAISALPGPITRDAVYQQLRSVTEFDAGGFIGPVNLGNETYEGCFIAMKVQNGRWTRLAPAQGFLC